MFFVWNFHIDSGEGQIWVDDKKIDLLKCIMGDFFDLLLKSGE